MFDGYVIVPIALLLWRLGRFWWLVLAGSAVFAVLGWYDEPNWDTAPAQARRLIRLRRIAVALLTLSMLSLLARTFVMVDFPRR